MLDDGDDPTKVDDADFDQAIDRLQEAVDSGQIRQFTGNDYSAPARARATSGRCVAWSGDVVQLPADNPKLEFVIPEAGGMIWTDNMLIPTGGDVFTASTFMNFVYRPGDRRADRGVRELHLPRSRARRRRSQAIDPELAANPLIFPDAETLAKVKIFDAEASNNEELQGEVRRR